MRNPPAPFRFRLPLLLLLAALPALPAQTNGLSPGSFVGTTFGWTSQQTRDPSADAVVVVDTFAGTASQININGFPSAPLEFPWAVHIENRLSFLLSSGSFSPATANFTLGNVYRVSWRNGAWTATQLNSNAIGEGVEAIAVVGDEIYFTTLQFFSVGNVPSSKVWRLSRWGGTASVVVDLTAAGVAGTGGAMVALGSTLHLFTFRSDPLTPTGEHWAIQTANAPPTATRIGTLPFSIRQGAAGWGFGSVQARWDAGAGAFLVAGVYGDLLWRDPVGNDIRHWADPNPANLSSGSDFFGAVAIDTDTGAIIVGDRQRHVEELRSPRGRFLRDNLTLPVPSTGFIVGLDYLSGTARYLPDGPIGCPQQSGEWPCSYINSRPTRGNAGFALTLDSTATTTYVAIGFDNVLWGGRLLPFDLTSWGAPGCSVGTSADIVMAAAGPNPTVPLPLPNMNATAFIQWAALDPVNPLGLVVSESRRMEVR